ncbi:unnamed protein product [Aspergillus niger]|nr:unnamed protein product [Aspergillus niger]
MSEVGSQALAGSEEYINVKLFEPVDHERSITGRGKSIMVYDPRAAMDSPPYWQHNDALKEGSSKVPAGFRVRVIGATVKFT